LRIAARIGATGVIVHLAAGAADEANLKYVIEEVTNLPDEVRNAVTFWLEIHTAKPGPFTYETPAKLRTLFERVKKCDTKGMKIGLCIDTAHLFSCGMALDTYEKADEWLSEVSEIGVPLMMHLNDSASSLASGIDQHENLCEGKIWSAYHPEKGHLPIEESGLVAILNWAESNDILTILERDDEGTIKDLRLIQSLGYF
jgi:endonuclease IV